LVKNRPNPAYVIKVCLLIFMDNPFDLKVVLLKWLTIRGYLSKYIFLAMTLATAKVLQPVFIGTIASQMYSAAFRNQSKTINYFAVRA
jgi:hypothetical protein